MKEGALSEGVFYSVVRSGRHEYIEPSEARAFTADIYIDCSLCEAAGSLRFGCQHLTWK